MTCKICGRYCGGKCSDAGPLVQLALENVALKKQLNDQLNDCINFDGGKLTDCIMEESSRILKEYG